MNFYFYIKNFYYLITISMNLSWITELKKKNNNEKLIKIMIEDEYINLVVNIVNQVKRELMIDFINEDGKITLQVNLPNDHWYNNLPDEVLKQHCQKILTEYITNIYNNVIKKEKKKKFSQRTNPFEKQNNLLEEKKINPFENNFTS